jgi:protein TonB
MLRRWTIIIAAISAPIAQAETKERAPKPIGGPWINADDYPPAAIRAGEEGKVAVAVAVDASGQPIGCRIVTSSGSSALDQASCRAMQRGRFEPARDANGTAIAGTYSRQLSWKLPKDTADKLGDTMTERSIWEFDAADRMVSCTQITGDLTVSCPTNLGEFKPILHSVARWRAASRITGPMRSDFIVRRAVDATDPPVSLPPLAAGDILTDEIVSRFSTDVTGRPSDCTSTVTGIDKPSREEAERGSPCARNVHFPVVGPDGRPVAARHMVVTRTTVRALAAKR